MDSSLARSVIAPLPHADPACLRILGQEEKHLNRLWQAWAEVNLLRDHTDPRHYACPRLVSSHSCPGTGLARMERPISLRVDQGRSNWFDPSPTCQHVSMPALLEMVIVAISCATLEGVAANSMLMLDRGSSARAIYITSPTPVFLSTANSFSLTLNSTSFI